MADLASEYADAFRAVKSGAGPIFDDPTFKELLALCSRKTELFLKTFFPERFSRPFSKEHYKLFEVLDDDSIQQFAAAAPRGFGKTSSITIGYAGRRVLCEQSKYVVPVSATSPKAILDAENLKNELIANTRIKELFGEVKTSSFSKEQWVTSMGSMIMPRGAGQQIRGLLYGMHRPDLILCDDLEKSDEVRSEDQRFKMKEWFFSDVCNSVDRASKNWRIIVIGTVLHQASLLNELLSDPSWVSIRLELFGDDCKSNWPEFISDMDVLKLIEAHRHRGQLDLLYREYRNLPISTEDATFRSSYFKYYTPDEIDKYTDLEHVVIMDPAKSVKAHSDDTAILCVAHSKSRGAIFIRDIENGKFYPDDALTKALAMADRFGASVIGVEVTSLNEFITQPLKTMMLRMGKFYNLIELKARATKEDRIASLVPYYRQGYIFHNKACCNGLEAQLLSFPRSAKDDIMDGLAYIIELFALGNRVFDPILETPGIDPYKTLKNDPPLMGWRRI